MSDRKFGPITRELIAAKKRIENEDDWCRGSYHRDGALCAAAALGYPFKTGEALHALIAAAQELEPDAGLPVLYINDTLGHAAVMQMYDHAIARAIKEGK